ncbi:MAG TPA: ABC transporter substrate-binding protein, partial [Acidimicrobiales bacterium]|nr:ABC transporter substrate-binding protein [Acidimicrobiales bacterium]
VSVSLASPLISQVPLLIIGSVTTVDRPVDALVTSNGPVIYDLSPGDHPGRGTYVYSSGNSTVNQAQAFINFAESKGWHHIGAITSTDASGQDGWKSIQKAVSGSNGAVTVTDHETFAPTAVSVTTQLSKIKATNPQALMVWTTGTPFSTVAKGMQQVGLNLPTMTTNGNESYKELTSISSELPSQLYFPSSQFQVPPSQLNSAAATAVTNFVSAMKAAGQPVPDEGDALAWDPGLIFISALKKVGINASASKIHSYIASLSDFEGVNGTYNFTDPSVPDNRGLTIQSVYITQWNSSSDNWVAVSGPAGKAK